MGKKQTTELEKPNANGRFKRATLGELPPLLLLIEEGEPVIGKVESVNIVEGEKTKKGSKVTQERDRVFYQIRLEGDVKALTPEEGSKEKVERVFTSGTLIGLPGSGNLDYQLKIVGAKLKGLLPENASGAQLAAFKSEYQGEDQVLYDALVGHTVCISRS